MLIARSLPSAVIGPSPAAPEPSAKQLPWARHPPSNCAGHAHAKQLRCGRASARANPVAARLRSTSRDSSRATRLPSCADYILRLQDTKPESLEISMLRLLLVALQLDFALPAALDEQEANAIQFVVQTTLQFEVRSPPESRRLLPAATRYQHTTAPPHTHLHTLNT